MLHSLRRIKNANNLNAIGIRMITPLLPRPLNEPFFKIVTAVDYPQQERTLPEY